MKNLYVFVIIAVLTISPIRPSVGVSQSDPPVLKIYEVNEYNEILRPFDRADNKATGVIIDKSAHIRLECQAYYPVQWVYTGNGIPELSSNISYSPTPDRNINQYTASAFLSHLNEHYTGSYRCSHTESLTLSPFLHIYVPGQNLFTTLEGRTVEVLSNETTALIPCSVTHPRVEVSLEKLTNRGLERPVVKSEDAIIYSPRKGFRINLDKIEDPEGSYVCIGHYNDIVRGVDYRVVYARGTGTFEEYKRPSEEICKGDECGSRCETHTDCPPNMHCYVDRLCRDPCTYSIRCGKSAECRLIDNVPICYCPHGFVGDATVECINP